jgi:O-antigen ligase
MLIVEMSASVGAENWVHFSARCAKGGLCSSDRMTASPDLTLTTPRLRAAERLWHAASAMLALMPLGMAVANRSSPAFLGLSAVLALAALSAERRLEAFLRDARAALASPLGLAVLAFLAWSIVSLAWSGDRPTSARALVEFWLSVATAFVLALALPERMSRASLWLLAASIAIACGAIMFELHTGLAFRQSIGARAQGFIFNRPALTIVVTSLPLLAWMLSIGGKRKAQGWKWGVGAGLAALIVAAIAQSDSGAAKLGLMVAVLVFVIAYRWPRFTLKAAAVATIATVGFAPLLGVAADRLIPGSVHERMADSHSRDRVDIWMSFGEAVRVQPLLGAGFGVSPRMGEMPVAAQVPPERRTLLAVGHPHNAALQVWAELGVVGAVLALAALLLFLRSQQSAPVEKMAPRLALFAAVAAVALVGHGAWQGWWPAAIGAAIVWFRSADRVSEESIR